MEGLFSLHRKNRNKDTIIRAYNKLFFQVTPVRHSIIIVVILIINTVTLHSTITTTTTTNSNSLIQA